MSKTSDKIPEKENSAKCLISTPQSRPGHQNQGKSEKFSQSVGINAMWCPRWGPGSEKGH